MYSVTKHPTNTHRVASFHIFRIIDLRTVAIHSFQSIPVFILDISWRLRRKKDGTNVQNSIIRNFISAIFSVHTFFYKKPISRLSSKGFLSSGCILVLVSQVIEQNCSGNVIKTLTYYILTFFYQKNGIFSSNMFVIGIQGFVRMDSHTLLKISPCHETKPLSFTIGCVCEFHSPITSLLSSP